MILRDLIDKLEVEEFDISDFRECPFYKNNKENDVKIGIYARVSKADKDAINNQLDYLKFFIKDLGISKNNIISYKDNGVSGTANEKRAEYRQMLRDLKTEKINCIITTNTDRLGRLCTENINVLYPENSIKFLYIDTDNYLINAWDNRQKIKKISDDSEAYVHTTSKKTRRGLKTKVMKESYISSKIPYGLEAIKDSNGIIKLKVEKSIKSEIVKEIFNDYINGLSLVEIENKMNKMGVQSPSGNRYWCKQTISSILRNPIYSGKIYQFKSKKNGFINTGEFGNTTKIDKSKWVLSGKFKGIIDEETFELVQEILDKASLSRKSNVKNVFTSLLRCGDCGQTLVYKKRSKGYICALNNSSGSLACSTHLVKEQELFNFIKELLVKKISDKDIDYKKILNKFVVTDEKKSFLVNQKENLLLESRECTKKILSMERQLEEKVDQEEIDILNEEIDNLKKEREYIRKQINMLDNRINDEFELLEKGKLIMENIDEYITADNSVLSLFIEEVKVYEDNKIEVMWKF